jgi:hypothetical protein
MTPIFVDYQLGQRNGISVIENLIKHGFKNVTLSTGQANQVQHQFHQVGKEFPIIQN